MATECRRREQELLYATGRGGTRARNLAEHARERGRGPRVLDQRDEPLGQQQLDVAEPLRQYGVVGNSLVEKTLVSVGIGVVEKQRSLDLSDPRGVAERRSCGVTRVCHRPITTIGRRHVDQVIVQTRRLHVETVARRMTAVGQKRIDGIRTCSNNNNTTMRKRVPSAGFLVPRGLVEALEVPDVPRGLEKAAAALNSLLVSTIAAGLGEQEVLRLAAETSDPAIAACARRWVAQFEFERAVGECVRLGPGARVKPRLVWEARTAAESRLVRSMVTEVLFWLIALARRSGGDQVKRMAGELQSGHLVDPRTLRTRRSRGRPRTSELEGICLLVLRERLFPSGLPLRSACNRAIKIMPAKWTLERLYERVKREARKQVPVPRGWKKTLLAQRCEPLRGDPFAVTPERLKWVMAERARRA
ncbi:MAG: hypothetical protein KJ015_09710 [Myxococcales bacterium]|nr:hypothetical protein [Myxococcales bacterium]